MDQLTKQRVVGALVLVVAALWLVPIFLDGPSGTTPTISETVELPGTASVPMQQKTIDLAARQAEPGDEPPVVRELPAADAVQTPVPEGQPDVRPQSPPADEPEPSTVAAAGNSRVQEAPPAEPARSDPPPSQPSGDLWAVQLGSFSDAANAEKLAQGLRRDGVAAFIARVESEGKTMHRVRVGPIDGRDAADAQALRLASSGHPARVVPHP